VKTFKGIIAPRLLIKQKWTTIMIMIKVAMKSYLHRQQCYCILNVEGPASMNTIKASKKMARFGDKIIATDSNQLSADFFMASEYTIMMQVC
jgi:hypothetical protein